MSDDNASHRPTWNHSPTLCELAPALAKAQGKMKHAIKDQNNPFFRSKYADLASVVDASRPALVENGLSVCQYTVGSVLYTMLLHSSGEWIRGHIELKPMRQVKDTGWVASEDPQSYGSCITYARRYAMAAITGVATEDDDGNAATGRTAQDAPVSNPPPEAKAPPASPPPPVPAEAPSSATQNDTRAELAIVCSKIADIMKTDAGTVLYHLTVNKDGKYGKRNPMDILWEAKGPKGPWSPLKAILSKAKESLVELQKPPDDNVLGDVDDPEWIK